MNKVLIRFPGYDRYAIKYLRRRDIDILNISYYDDGNVYTIWETDLEKLDESLIEIVSYRGFKRLLKILYVSRHFLLSSLLVVIIMVAISNLVVDVEVVHSNKDVRVLIEDELYDHGVKPFIVKKSFKELQEIKQTILDEHPEEIEWLEINDDGMKYTVRVEERIITVPEEEPEYCNIVSTKDSIVLGMVAKKGQSVVSTNDFVKKDSVLISGQITFNDETKSHVCADGDVYGNTWYNVSISLPLSYSIKNYTGQKRSNIGFEFGSVYNSIFKVHFDDYDVKKTELFSLGKFALYKESDEEYVEEEKVYTEQEAIEEALRQAKEKLLIKLDSQAEILSEKVLQSSTYDSIISVDIFYSVKEIIGTRVIAEIVEEIVTEEPKE